MNDQALEEELRLQYYKEREEKKVQYFIKKNPEFTREDLMKAEHVNDILEANISAKGERVVRTTRHRDVYVRVKSERQIEEEESKRREKRIKDYLLRYPESKVDELIPEPVAWINIDVKTMSDKGEMVVFHVLSEKYVRIKSKRQIEEENGKNDTMH